MLLYASATGIFNICLGSFRCPAGHISCIALSSYAFSRTSNISTPDYYYFLPRWSLDNLLGKLDYA